MLRSLQERSLRTRIEPAVVVFAAPRLYMFDSALILMVAVFFAPNWSVKQ